MRLFARSGLRVVVCVLSVIAAPFALGSLGGCHKSSEVAPVAQSGDIRIDVGAEGFNPSTVKVSKGKPATLIFTRTVDDTCATEVVFPALNIKKDLPKGTPVAVVLPTDKPQTLTFQCGMGMYKSSVVVLD